VSRPTSPRSSSYRSRSWQHHVRPSKQHTPEFPTGSGSGSGTVRCRQVHGQRRARQGACTPEKPSGWGRARDDPIGEGVDAVGVDAVLRLPLRAARERLFRELHCRELRLVRRQQLVLFDDELRARHNRRSRTSGAGARPPSLGSGQQMCPRGPVLAAAPLRGNAQGEEAAGVAGAAGPAGAAGGAAAVAAPGARG
jgi:hypothetical protein